MTKRQLRLPSGMQPLLGRLSPIVVLIVALAVLAGVLAGGLSAGKGLRDRNVFLPLTRLAQSTRPSSPTAGAGRTPVPATVTRSATAPASATLTAEPGTATPVPAAATSAPVACTPVQLARGPSLILTGNNAEMKVFWQWSGNTTFRLRWERDGAAAGSADVTPYDTANHLYAYTIGGLQPGARYDYQAIVGTQCSGGTFYAPPPASATSVKFVAYGDTRTYGSVHDGLAGQVISLFQADPAFQTLNLHVGDWVSSDAEAAWAGEWFDPAYANIRREGASIAETGVRGNHEGSAVFFRRYFPQPYQPGGLYRSFDYGPMHVVLLDQYTPYRAGTAQYNWLKGDLASSQKPWKMVVLHEPGWSAGGHDNNATVQNDLQPLFRQYGVAIVFGGHNHYYARAVVDGIQHLTVGGGGAELYAPDPGYPNVVAASRSHSYGQFTISGNTLSARIVDDAGAVIDAFTITR